MKKKKVILLIGPQGAGKGENIASLVRSLSQLGFGRVRQIGSGNALRAQYNAGTSLGLAAGRYMFELKRLVPNRIVTPLIAQHVAAGSDFGVDVLEGFPRTPKQLKDLLIELEKVNAELVFAVLLDAPDKVLIKRLRGRRVCKKGHVYHVEFKPPKRPGICDQCGRRLLRRKDDTVEGIRIRLSDYRSQTVSMVKKLHVPVLTIDAVPPIQVVKKNMLRQVRRQFL